MNTCEYCGCEVKRKIFCSPSHKSMYYRKKKSNAVRMPIEEKKVEMPKTWRDKYGK